MSAFTRRLLVLILLPLAPAASAQVERVWLSHRSNDPMKLVVNWTTRQPGESVVRFGRSAEYGREAREPGSRTEHHVEVALPEKGGVYHYAVRSGEQRSADATFKGPPTAELRVAVVANWQARPRLDALLKDDPHLLLSAGDNVASLWQTCGPGVRDCAKPYAALIDAYPELFRSTPFLPALGNHDREIRPRGDRPPAEPVYDVEAAAFRRFFDLPGEEWRWHLDLPDFRVRLVALDLNHCSDRGTTWQTCHDFGRESDQFKWYSALMAGRPPGFVVTLYNERNATVRGLEKGAWREPLKRSSLVVAGFGYFAERAEADGVTYLNTSLGGKGAKYPDPASKFFASEDGYVLLSVRAEEQNAGRTMRAELKSLDGRVLDATDVKEARR